jgi:hypothetical protein
VGGWGRKRKEGLRVGKRKKGMGVGKGLGVGKEERRGVGKMKEGLG